MQIVAGISEHEMIATFLRAEYASERFGSDLKALFNRDGMDPRIITTPDWTDDSENAYRRALLGEFRGYGCDSRLFEGFPSRIAWERATVRPDELLNIKYIEYDYWVTLSRGTRSPRDGAEAIRDRVNVFGVPIDGFLRVAEALRNGAQFPELICVRSSVGGPVVVVEGHVRLTAYALEPDMIPSRAMIILGTSSEVENWGCY
ncbi:MAG: hypothetical protein EA426_16590 [Spirochaetaceae bacterium]|nr:MAG: hypothetical protein EA426_16590 [Spirochaetaceae bacterium]